MTNFFGHRQCSVYFVGRSKTWRLQRW